MKASGAEGPPSRTLHPTSAAFSKSPLSSMGASLTSSSASDTSLPAGDGLALKPFCPAIGDAAAL
jgi:hypothetical protein